MKLKAWHILFNHETQIIEEHQCSHFFSGDTQVAAVQPGPTEAHLAKMIQSQMEAASTPVEDDQVTGGGGRQLPIPLHQAQALIQVHSDSLSHQASGFKARGGILSGLGCPEPDVGKLLHTIGKPMVVVRRAYMPLYSGVRPNSAGS